MPVAAQSEAPRPNFVFIISDDHSWTDLGCYGNAAARTPNLDRLASQGARYTHCFVTSPQCSPNRSAILTGLPPHQTATSRLHAPMPGGQETFLEPLREHGYFLGAWNKVHQGAEFDKTRWHYHGAARLSPTDFLRQRPKDRPFFFHVGFTDPHRPYSPGAFDPPTDPSRVPVPKWLPDTPEIRKDLADYLDEIARMDRQAGEVLRVLEEQGVADNTVVMFTGDNGMPFPPRAKGTLYEDGIRVPLIVRWPGRVQPGTVSGKLVSHIDLPVTWLESARIPKPLRMKGVNLMTGNRDEIFSERNWHDNFDLIRCIRTRTHKLIYNGLPDKPHRPIRDLADSPTWASYLALNAAGKLSAAHQRALAPQRPLLELYDLERDPDELNNLADAPASSKIQEDLLNRLGSWMDSTNDFLPPPYRMLEGKRRPTL